MTTTSNSKTVETLAKSSEELLNTIDELLADKKRLLKEMDKMIGKDLENSFALQDALSHIRKQKAENTVMEGFIRTWLMEFEEKFLSEGKADSPQIAQDYLTQARFMHNHFDRVNHSIRQVQEWYDNLNPWEQTDKLLKS